VYLVSGASLSGFTLTNGGTRSETDDGHRDDSDGGVYGGTLTNCALKGNSAEYFGGGARGGTLYRCTLTANLAGIGGGAAGSTLNNCTLKADSADYGGGAAGIGTPIYAANKRSCPFCSVSVASGALMVN